jgi:hypothetical protein
LQVATVRALGLFLEDPLDVPTEAVDYVAVQVGAADPSVAKEYLRRYSCVIRRSGAQIAHTPARAASASSATATPLRK